jgi:antirestriction protein ArdC
MAGQTTSDLLATLTDGISRLTTSESWKKWLDIQSRFHRYSFGNTLLIALQRPDATQVAGFHTWRRMGRFVRKGEKGIAILAPIMRRVRIEDDETGEVNVVVGSPHSFRPAYVFDLSQTDGEELPATPVHQLAGDDPDHVFLRLLKVAAGIDYTVEFADFGDSRNGDCTFPEHRIRIRHGLEPVMACKTLSHEQLAHALLHGNGFGRRDLAELEAESTAYLVTAQLGIDSSAYSFGYAAAWAGGGPEAVRAITDSAHRIVRAARTILGDAEDADRGQAA